MTETLAPVEIFCSYANADEDWRQKLETHLSLLRRQGLVSFWHDRLITPGTDWARAVDTHLETASIILLLISADFFASDYCYGIEMKRALERETAGEARVVPILVRPVNWMEAPFAYLQVLPTDAKPIVSWPDSDTALTDITAGIRRMIEDVPMLAASAPRATLPNIWNIPYSRNSFFLGRESELAQIYQRLQTGQAVALSQPQAISGLGGIGKTQLALEYAYRYHQEYTTVFWARAESTEALIASYIVLGQLLRLPEREARKQDIVVQAVKDWLQTHRDWLLILDNADELALLHDFLPSSLGGHLLLTTRAAVAGRLARQMEIETLLPEQGALLLLRRSGLIAPDAFLKHASSQERDLALQISQELGNLPLAIDQAGAYLEETQMDLEGYWHIYQQRRADLLLRRGGLVTDHPAPVATTWSLSFQKVEEKNLAAADLLRLCAFLCSDAIPEEILRADASVLGPSLAPLATDAILLNQAIEALRAYSLIRRDPREKTLSIHRLVQAVLQDAQEEVTKRIWSERALVIVNAAFPEVEYGTWSLCERLLPQALAAMQTIERYQVISEEAERLLHETVTYLRNRARYAEAERLYQQVLRIWKAHLGSEHPTVAHAINFLAILYSDQGRYAEAEPFYQQAIRIWELHLGPDHHQVGISINGLADLYREQGRYTEAEPLYQRALQIKEQRMGPDHFQVTYPLDGLADLSRKQEKYAEAELLYQRALQIKEQCVGSEHPDVAHTLNGLANLYREQGKYIEAGLLYQRALRIRKQALIPHHPETAETAHDLAWLWEKQGNGEEAKTWYALALTIREHALGEYHPKTTETRQRLIALLHTMGQHEEAVQLEANQPKL